METYHGTSSVTATQLEQGQVDVTLGGGELGQGFYTGEYLHEAKAWSLHTTGERRRNVVAFDSDDDDILALDVACLDRIQALSLRARIRANGQTHSYRMQKDAIWAPIVGSTKAEGQQFKWESLQSEGFLNGPMTKRRIT